MADGVHKNPCPDENGDKLMVLLPEIFLDCDEFVSFVTENHIQIYIEIYKDTKNEMFGQSKQNVDTSAWTFMGNIQVYSFGSSILSKRPTSKARKQK